MDLSITAQIAALRGMTVAELQGEWFQLYGQPTKSRNRDYLWKRLSWRIQELACGGLTDTAKQRIEELAPEGFVRARTPNVAPPAADPAKPAAPHRDPRLPSPGTVLTRQYHGNEIRVLALDDGFEWEGQHYRSLSAVARAVTGQRWNGLLFFGLTERKRKA